MKSELAHNAKLQNELGLATRDATRSRREAEDSRVAEKAAYEKLATVSEHRDKLQDLCNKLRDSSSASLAKIAAASDAERLAREEESARVAGIYTGLQEKLEALSAVIQENEGLRNTIEKLNAQLAAERARAASELKIKALETQMAEVCE